MQVHVLEASTQEWRLSEACLDVQACQLAGKQTFSALFSRCTCKVVPEKQFYFKKKEKNPKQVVFAVRLGTEE